MLWNTLRNLGKVSLTLRQAQGRQLTAHSSQLTLKLKGRFQKIKRQTLSVLLIISLLLSQLTSLFVPLVYAASSPWTQTDWSGGSGQTSWSDSTKYDSSSSVTTSTVNQVTLTQTSSWYNASWAYRKKITFDNSAQAENLTNFPVLVKLSSSNINYSNTQDSGQDIRFTDSDGTTLLSYEIEKWDETGSSFVWVKVPQIDASSATDNIYMYYGNSSATDGQAATSVWDSNYKMVQHLKETSGTTTSDSTSNTNNGTKVSATEPNPSTSGQFDGGQSFDGVDDKITTGSLIVSDNFTLEAWINKSASLTNNGACSSDQWYCGFGIVDSEVAGLANDYGMSVKDNKAIFGVGNPDQSILGTTTLSNSTWYHIVATRNKTSGRIEIYVNGALENSTTATNTNSLNSNTFDLIGNSGNTSGRSFNGIIDEVRISDSARSAAWIAASYKTEADTFNTFASEEQQYPSSGTLTSSIFDTEITGGAAWGTLTYSATTPSNTSVSVKVRTSNSSSMAGATAFGSCTAISSGSDISSNSCVTDSHRYIQYLLTLSNTDSTSTPTFTSFSLAFSSYDADAPSISLTALTPDPNSDTTPTLSGTATDTIGTVSNAQFQMDSTSGSWTACTASDGSFNSASEAFSCTAATLTDGSHTMYVRATDSNGNTTSSGYASDTFTIDATNPVSIDLDSPGDNSYTNSERPTYKWKATTDATAGLSKYVLEIDNPSIGSSQPSGDFTIDSIPTSRTTDYDTNKYTIRYENFSDSDSTNNYISVYTKSHSDWGSSENDGKLREGRISWKVKAVDNAGNETSSSRTLFVDRSSPKVEFTQVNDTPFSSSTFSTTDKTPTVYGKITDPLAGGDSSQTQDENGPKVASGPKQIEIKVEKVERVLGLASNNKLITLYTINVDKPWWTCNNKEITDNSKQKCDPSTGSGQGKYLPFEYTSKDTLDLGTYKITLTGKDKADNTSSETSFTLNITTLARIITPEEKKTIEEEVKELPKEEQEKVKEELEITKPVEPSALEKAGEQISQTSKSIFNTTGNIISGIFNGIGQGVKFTIDTTGKALAFVGQGVGNGAKTVGQGLAFAGEKIGQGVSTLAQGTGDLLASIGQEIGNTGKAIGEGYNQLANNAPGVTKSILTGIGNGVSATASTIASVADGTSRLARRITDEATNIVLALARTTGNGFSALGSTANNLASLASGSVANVTFTIGEKTQDISDTAGLAIIKFTYNFVSEPTKISDTKVVKITPTSVTIFWTTNHPANGKVNYGLTADYGQDVQSEKRITHHEFTITDLKPNTTYYYEVMSHNKNYVYDAHHTFTTPEK